MGLLEWWLNRRLREERARDRELARREAGRNRIALVEAAGGDWGGPAEADFLSDSQTGEIHRIVTRDGQLQIDAIPIVRRLLNRELSLRNVAVLLMPPGSPEHFLGAHFVLDEHTRHVYRVLLSSRCCVADRLWGKGLDEVQERPLGGALISWSDLHDEAARASLEAVQDLVPQSASWGLSFVSTQTEPGSDIQRRLFLGSRGAVRFHTRSGATPDSSTPAIKGAIEGAIEIEWQQRIILVSQGSQPPRSGRKSSLRIRSEAGALPF